MADTDVPNLSIIIPTLNAKDGLPACLQSLEAWPARKELIVVDGGSKDETVALAYKVGAKVLPTERGRGQQLQRGGKAAKGQWLLFLHADTVLQNGWEAEVQAFMDDIGNRQRVAAFRFTLDDDGPQAGRLERMVAWRCKRLGLPYGDQGLLTHRDLYEVVGGYKPIPAMEDVDLVRRLGRDRIHMFETAAVTSSARYVKSGWWARPSWNLFCLFLHICRVPPLLISRLYG